MLQIDLSDFHESKLAVLKAFYSKHKPYIIQYKVSKTFIVNNLEQIFYKSYVFKMFNVRNLKQIIVSQK